MLMVDFYEYSTPELVRLLGERFKEYRMRCNPQVREWYGRQSVAVNIHSAPESDWSGGCP